jgi:hypothetical protein
MRHYLKLPVWFLGMLVMSLSVRFLVTDASGHPYTGLAARNVFGLLPPQQPPDPRPPPLPRITLVGITTILQDKRALLKVQFPAQPPEPGKEVSCILTLGQREGPIEVLAIDETAGSVRVNNSGTEMLLSFGRDGPRQQDSPPASVAPPPPRRLSRLIQQQE